MVKTNYKDISGEASKQMYLLHLQCFKFKTVVENNYKIATELKLEDVNASKISKEDHYCVVVQFYAIRSRSPLKDFALRINIF